MSFCFPKCMNFLLAFTVGAVPLLPQDHVVPPSELHRRVQTATQARQGALQRLDRFFSSAPAKNALAAARIDTSEVRRSVSLLSDSELARLSARADHVQAQFAAGALSNQELTYIVIALATAVIILVIVAR